MSDFGLSSRSNMKNFYKEEPWFGAEERKKKEKQPPVLSRITFRRNTKGTANFCIEEENV